MAGRGWVDLPVRSVKLDNGSQVVYPGVEWRLKLQPGAEPVRVADLLIPTAGGWTFRAALCPCLWPSCGYAVVCARDVMRVTHLLIIRRQGYVPLFLAMDTPDVLLDSDSVSLRVGPGVSQHCIRPSGMSLQAYAEWALVAGGWPLTSPLISLDGEEGSGMDLNRANLVLASIAVLASLVVSVTKFIDHHTASGVLWLIVTLMWSVAAVMWWRRLGE